MIAIKLMIIMDAVLSEIAKHLAFHSKIAIKLCNRRCMQFVRIYQVPIILHEKWTEERIDLFAADLCELYYHVVCENDHDIRGYMFHYSRIAKMTKLVKFFIDGCALNDDFDFSVLNNMKTLKSLVINGYSVLNRSARQSKGLLYRDIKNISDTLKTLNLEQLDCDSSMVFDNNSLDHMRLKYLNDYRYFNEDRTGNYSNHLVKNLRHVLINYASPEMNKIELNPMTLSYEYCRRNIDDLIMFLDNAKIHSFNIAFYSEIDEKDLRKLFKNRKWYSLKMTYPYFTVIITHIPIDIILQNNISHIVFDGFFDEVNKYSADDIELIRKHGTEITYITRDRPKAETLTNCEWENYNFQNDKRNFFRQLFITHFNYGHA